MQPFTSIESFKHARAKVNRYCEAQQIARPTIRYQGTAKLHGTNSGFRVPNSQAVNAQVIPQKRTAEISILNDNAGFAVFCHNNEQHLRELARKVTATDLDISIFGEWVGGNIQKGVAVTQLEKHFVIFNAYVEAQGYKPVQYITKHLSSEDIESYNNHGIYFIDQVPLHVIDINFAFPENHMQELTDATLAVETECPWGKFRGVSGVGEGIVYQPIDEPYASLTDLWFKVKGLAHKVEGKTGVKGLSADPVRITNIQALVNELLPAWRLEQGVSQLKEDGKDIIHQSIGDYLKWIGMDVVKECADDITASGYVWKDLAGIVNKTAREYFLKAIDEESL